MNNEQKKTLREKVLENIKSGSVTMRPRWHFVLQTALIITGALLVLLVILYLSSFILFEMHQTGAWFAPGLGFSGWGIFFRSLPWILILFAAIFMVILEVLVRHFSFTYRKPLLYSVVAILLVAVFGGALAAPLHRAPFHDARMNHFLGPAGPFYRQFGPRHPREVHRGQVTDVADNNFTMEELDGETFTVMLASDTPFNFREAAIGKEVIVFGRESSTVIEAARIELVNP